MPSGCSCDLYDCDPIDCQCEMAQLQRFRRRWLGFLARRRAAARRLQIFFARREPPLGEEIVDLIAEFVQA